MLGVCSLRCVSFDFVWILSFVLGWFFCFGLCFCVEAFKNVWVLFVACFVTFWLAFPNSIGLFFFFLFFVWIHTLLEGRLCGCLSNLVFQLGLCWG